MGVCSKSIFQLVRKYQLLVILLEISIKSVCNKLKVTLLAVLVYPIIIINIHVPFVCFMILIAKSSQNINGKTFRAQIFPHMHSADLLSGIHL